MFELVLLRLTHIANAIPLRPAVPLDEGWAQVDAPFDPVHRGLDVTLRAPIPLPCCCGAQVLQLVAGSIDPGIFFCAGG